MPKINFSESKVKRVHNTKEAKKLLSSDGPLMLIIYADWCGHCQAAEPEWIKLSNDVDSKAKVYAIESDEYDGGDVSGYPTIKIVKGGKVSDYNGGRTSDDMKDALLGKGNLLGGKRTRRNRSRRLRRRTGKSHRPLR